MSFLASAQTSSSPVPVPPPGGDASAGTNKGVATAPISKSAGAPVDSTKYKIGPADVLSVQVWHEPEFSGLMAVHEDGKFTMPLVGDLQAGGKTPIEVQEEIAGSLKKYLTNPLVQVYIQDVGSKRYYIDGFVGRPGEYALVVPTTILEAISKAGGPGDFANRKKIYVLRGDKRIYFNWNDVIKGKHMEQNILLQNGDHIVIN
jgi:polysaccharide export outer membrane protein